MPVIHEYLDKNAGLEEPRYITVPRKSPMEIALHEAVHAVILRLEGLDIWDVIDQDDAAWTRLVESQIFTAAALMAPEIYMKLHNIECSDQSVSCDREALASCYHPEALDYIQKTNREWLEIVFRCPAVGAAISVLSARMHNELCEHKRMAGTSIHEIIDPILVESPHADGLRGKLNG